MYKISYRCIDTNRSELLKHSNLVILSNDLVHLNFFKFGAPHFEKKSFNLGALLRLWHSILFEVRDDLPSN